MRKKHTKKLLSGKRLVVKRAAENMLQKQQLHRKLKLLNN